MAQDNQITVRFKAAGHKELRQAIYELGRAQADLEKDSRRYNALTKKMQKNTLLGVKNNRLLSNSFATIRSKMLLASFAAGLFGASVGKLAKLFGEQEKAQQKLSIQLGGTSQRLLNFASAQQQVTRFGDEVTVSAMATAAAYTKNQDQIEELTKASMDYAVFSGQDLNSAVEIVSKSIFSSTNALSRYGIQFSGTAGTADRFGNALDAIREKAGGLAEGEAGTLNFALDQMGNAIGDLGENIGSIFVPAILLAANGLKTLSEFMSESRVKSYGTAMIVAAGAFEIWNKGATLAAAKTAIFNKTMVKSIVGFVAFIAIGEAIKRLGLFKDEVEDTTIVLDKVLTKTQQQVLANHKLDISYLELKNVIGNSNDIVAKLEINKHKQIQTDELLKAGIIDEIEQRTRLNDLTKEEMVLQRAYFNERLASIQQTTNAVGGAISAIEANGNAIANANKKEELSNAKTQKQKDAIEEKYAKQAEERARKLKGWKVATAISNVALGVTQTWADPTIQPTWLKPVIIAAQVAAGLAQIATIQGQKFEQGGMVGGRRHSAGGTMIEAEQGEFVMSRNAVDAVGIEAMNRINAGGGAGAVNINFTGNVMSKDFIEDEAIPMIKEAIRRGADIGVA